MSCFGSPSHSTPSVVTGESGAAAGTPVKRTPQSSWTNFTGLPSASSFAEVTFVVRPPMVTVSPGQAQAWA